MSFTTVYLSKQINVDLQENNEVKGPSLIIIQNDENHLVPSPDKNENSNGAKSPPPPYIKNRNFSCKRVSQILTFLFFFLIAAFSFGIFVFALIHYWSQDAEQRTMAMDELLAHFLFFILCLTYPISWFAMAKFCLNHEEVESRSAIVNPSLNSSNQSLVTADANNSDWDIECNLQRLIECE